MMSNEINHDLNHEITVKAPIEIVRKALTTRTGLASWNTRNVTGSGDVGSEWILVYGEVVFYWKILVSTDTEVIWKCTQGPGDSPGTIAEYILTKGSDSSTKILLAHKGWPHKEANYKKCNTLWGGLMFHLARYVETSIANPMH